MPNWTKEQSEAINTIDHNVLVCASAGSGKTAVLIERLMKRVVKDRISLDKIIAMTFTEAAASEMKKRLSLALNNAYELANEEDKIYINSQLTLLNGAHISTIHSFALSIIQDYSYIINVSPKRANTILDSSLAQKYKKDALDLCFKEEYKLNDPSFKLLLDMSTSALDSTSALEKAILSLASLVDTTSDEDSLYNKILASYNVSSSINEMPTLVLCYYYDYIGAMANSYYNNLSIYKDFFLNTVCDEKKTSLISVKLDNLISSIEYLNKKDYKAFYTQILCGFKIALPTLPRLDNIEYMKDIRKSIVNDEDSIANVLFSDEVLVNDLKYSYPAINKLIMMCKTYMNNYNEIKIANEVIDFNDMEHMAIEILRANDNYIAKRYINNIEEIMVDEFQDSNEIQNELVALISRNNNVFRVGDIKQSIYGFRHAKPSIMRNLLDNATELDKIIYLQKNFRSKSNIIEFNNSFYNKLMSIEGFSKNFNDYDLAEAGREEQLKDMSPIDLYAINSSKCAENNESNDELKAKFISKHMMELKETTKYDWKDFAILVRSNAKKDALVDCFNRLNIPFFVDIKHGFYESKSVSIMIALLTCIVNPSHDLSLVAVLSSELFKYDDNKLAAIKIEIKKSDEYISYYDYISKHSNDLDIITEYHNNLSFYSISKLLSELYDINDYYHSYCNLQNQTNLDALYNYALDYENSNGGDVIGFLTLIEDISNDDTSQSVPMGKNDNVVRIMTIHQSKGLQFPVVYLYSSSSFSNIEVSEFIVCDEALGIGMNCIRAPYRISHKSIARIAIEHKINRQNLEEEMRVLYVATTRCEERLIMVDVVKDIDKLSVPLNAPLIYNRNGYTSWIIANHSTMISPSFKIIPIDSPYEANPYVSIVEELVTSTPKLHTIEHNTTASKTASSTHKIRIPSSLSFASSYATNVGNSMHKVMEHIKKQDTSSESIVNLANSLNLELSSGQVGQIHSLVNNKLFRDIVEDDSYELNHELSFMVKLRGDIVHGYMDFVGVSANTIVLIDYKSDTFNDEDKFLSSYSEQLYLYTEALKLMYTNRTITSYIYSFHLNKFIKAA
ncbi:MAG: UvrD-helicase domain-containing protein [Erysipelotrichaceae bacterium]